MKVKLEEKLKESDNRSLKVPADILELQVGRVLRDNAGGEEEVVVKAAESVE